MKKILIALLLVSIIAGCKKNNVKESESAIQGKWLAQELVETALEGGVEVERKVKNTFTANDYVLFNGDGTAVSSYEGNGLQHSVFRIEGKKLILAEASDPNQFIEFEIKVWTMSDLVLTRESVEVNKNVRYSDIIEISFKKL